MVPCSPAVWAVASINLLPAEYKLCSFNCLYCQYGWTKNVTFTPGERLKDLPSADAVASALETGLAEFHATTKRSMPSRSAATAAPTLYPALAKVIVKLKKLRDRYQPDARIAILSNSSTAGDPAIRAALELLDLKIMKFDAGSEEMFGQLNHPAAPVYMDKIVVGLKELKNTLLQSCFVQGSPTPILIRLRCGSRNSGKFIRWESKSIHWIVSRLIKNSKKSV